MRNKRAAKRKRVGKMEHAALRRLHQEQERLAA